MKSILWTIFWVIVFLLMLKLLPGCTQANPQAVPYCQDGYEISANGDSCLWVGKLNIQKTGAFQCANNGERKQTIDKLMRLP